VPAFEIGEFLRNQGSDGSTGLKATLQTLADPRPLGQRPKSPRRCRATLFLGCNGKPCPRIPPVSKPLALAGSSSSHSCCLRKRVSAIGYAQYQPAFSAQYRGRREPAPPIPMAGTGKAYHACSWPRSAAPETSLLADCRSLTTPAAIHGVLLRFFPQFPLQNSGGLPGLMPRW